MHRHLLGYIWFSCALKKLQMSFVLCADTDTSHFQTATMTHSFFALLILCVLSYFSTCSSSSPHPVLLEINTRPYFYKLSNQYGKKITLSTIPDEEFLKWSNLGINIVWFMGLWQVGEYGWARATDFSMRQSYGKFLPNYTMSDIIGSPYQISNYDVNPDLGVWSDLRMLKIKLNALGIKLFVDFVPNHHAVDSLVEQHPEYFVRAPKNLKPPFDPNQFLPNGVSYGKDPYSGSWQDTAQFNYWNKDTWNLQIQWLLKMAVTVDGFRCDMAMLVLNDIIQQTWGSQLSSWGFSRPADEFWSNAISEVKARYPDVLFMAEVYWGLERKLQSLGFDYTYDKVFLDKLSSGSVGDIKSYIATSGYEYLSKSAHFVENHDEDRAVFHFGSPERALAAGFIIETLPGLRFNYDGQFQGFRNRLLVQLRRSQSEPVNTHLEDTYAKLLKIIKTEEAFHNGTYTDLGPNAGDALLAWKYTIDNDKVMVVINFSDTEAYGQIVLTDATSSSGDDLVIDDLLNDKQYHRSVKEMKTTGLKVLVDPWWCQIFKY
mmetsp:Transcript_4552/g.17217  ORF Transcript_4552/g.17217 Transcript_4552/m.17217 type:complete len:544 (-) Transcript_4552:601-2232(-)